MKVSYKRLPLATAVISVLALQVASANETAEPHVHLEALEATVDRQGTKVKTNVVTLQEKDESTATDLRGLLQSEPAIDFSGGNGTSQYLTIRGMGQNSVDVKVDNAYSDSQILYHQGRHMLDPSLVKIVSVQKGAGSASAGIGATNGAIIAKTVDAQDLLKNTDKDWGVKVNAGYSSNDEHSYGVTGFGKADNFDFLVSYNQVDQDNYKAGKKKAVLSDAPDIPNDGLEQEFANTVDGSKTVPYSALDKVSYLAKAGLTLGDHRFVLSHFNTTNKGVRLLREEFNVIEPNNPNHQDAQYRKLVLENTNLEYQGSNLGFADKVDANIYMMKNSRISADDVRSGKAGYPGGVAGKNTATINTKGANVNFDSQLHDDVLFKYGVNYRHQEITPNKALKATDTILLRGREVALGADVLNQEKTDIGIYTEVIGDIGNLTLTGGLRYDHFNFKAMDGKKVSDGAFSPSIGLIYQATPSLSFNAVHNHATRSPRMYDALMSHGERGIVSIADNAKAEKAKNSEVGFNYNQNLNNGGQLSITGGYFWQEIDNLLNSATATRHDVARYSEIQNVGFAKNKGFELDATYRLDGLTARFGIADSKPEFYSTSAFNNREFGNRIGRTYTAGLAYRFAQPDLEIGTNFRRVDDTTGNSAWMNHVGNAPRQNSTNVKKFGYQTFDVFANWKPLKNDSLNVNFGINNITDEYYRSHTSQGLPSAGREYRIGINYTY